MDKKWYPVVYSLIHEIYKEIYWFPASYNERFPNVQTTIPKTLYGYTKDLSTDIIMGSCSIMCTHWCRGKKKRLICISDELNETENNAILTYMNPNNLLKHSPTQVKILTNILHLNLSREFD